jgi:hypothetical protein
MQRLDSQKRHKHSGKSSEMILFLHHKIGNLQHSGTCRKAAPSRYPQSRARVCEEVRMIGMRRTARSFEPPHRRLDGQPLAKAGGDGGKSNVMEELENHQD